jgi:hypothetical protein
MFNRGVMLRRRTFVSATALMLLVGMSLRLAAQQGAVSAQSSAQQDDPEANPPVTQADLKIVQRAKAILARPAQWNRADNRKCADEAKIFSIYCAIEKATTASERPIRTSRSSDAAGTVRHR